MLATIPLDRIATGTRLRSVSEAQVESLVNSIGEVGLLNPITVYPRKVYFGGVEVDGFGLIAGLHRKTAYERLGLVEIEAQILDLGDLERQIAECDENLCGPQLGPAERARFTLRRKEAYEALHPETKQGGAPGRAGGGKAKVDNLSSFAESTALATGKDERTVRRDAERGEKVIEDALDLIAGTALDSGVYLDRIKGLGVGDQVAAVQRDLRQLASRARERSTVEKKQRRATREIDLAARQAALPDKRYGVILADPEWRFEPYSRDSGMDRAADNHYPTSSLEAIKARPVADIAADDCVLFLWATVPMLPQALEVMAAWGFDYKSHTIWRKADRKPSRQYGHGGLVLGTGYWFRNGHELLLVGTRGAVPAPAMGMQHASMFDAPPLRHSAKPVEAYELIESYFPTLPKIELNAREARAGWDAWGFEAPDQASESTVETPLAADVDGGISPAGVEVDRDRQLIPGSHSQEADPAASPAGDQEPGRRSGDEDGHHLLAADLSDDPRADYRARVAASGVRPGGYSRDTAAPILRAAYATDPVVPTKQIAADLGHPIGTILTWASREGLTKAERRGGPDRLGQARAGAVA